MITVTASVKHRVQTGDTLLYLSWLYYGSADGLAWIWLENRAVIGGDPDNLVPGQVLVIPTVETKLLKVAVSPRTVRPGEPHVGDRRITASIREYGESWRWQVFKVFEANARPYTSATLDLPGRGVGFPLTTATVLRGELGRV
jgi:hypothetical protein